MSRNKQSLKDRLYLQQNGECIYCDRRIYNKAKLTIEHILPSCKTSNNYVLACNDCNNIKGNFYLMNKNDGYTKLTEELVYRSLILQIYYMRQAVNHFQDIVYG